MIDTEDDQPTLCECAGKGCPVCAPTEDGPEMDEDDSPPGYERRRFNREGV